MRPFLAAMVFGLTLWAMPVLADDRADVDQVFHEWIADVTSGSPDKVMSLYDVHAVLLPTLSAQIRTTPGTIKSYFDHFTALPHLRADIGESHIRIYGDTAVNSGFYTFSYLRNGKTVAVPARFSFTYVKEPQGWMIVDHHSSQVPKEP